MKCFICGVSCKMKIGKAEKWAYDCCGKYFCEDCYDKHNCEQFRSHKPKKDYSKFIASCGGAF